MISGYQEDGSLFIRNGYGTITIPQLSDDMTIVVKRTLYNAAGLDNYQALVGVEHTSSQNSAFLEYLESYNYMSSCFGGNFDGRSESEITWMTKQYKDMAAPSSSSDVLTANGTVYLGRLRSNVNGNYGRIKISALYIFNKSLHPLTIEKFIQTYIDESYVLQ